MVSPPRHLIEVGEGELTMMVAMFIFKIIIFLLIATTIVHSSLVRQNLSNLQGEDSLHLTREVGEGGVIAISGYVFIL